jgi:hypothetical protein
MRRGESCPIFASPFFTTLLIISMKDHFFAILKYYLKKQKK